MGCGPSEKSKQLLFALVVITQLIVSVICSSAELGGHVRRRRVQHEHHPPGISRAWHRQLSSSSSSWGLRRGGDKVWQASQRAVQLTSRCSQKYVTIFGSTKVFATKTRGQASLLTLESVKLSNGSVLGLRIRSTKYDTYICFNKKGRLVVRHNGQKKRCIFLESMADKYTTFRSAANQHWYIGFRSNGKPMRGYQYHGASDRKRRCFQFLKKYTKNPNSRPQWSGPGFNFSQLAKDLLNFKDDKT